MALLVSLLLAVALGWLAQRTGLCMVRAVQGIRMWRPGLLLTIVGCGVWFWLASPLFIHFPLGEVLRRHAIGWPFAVGGLLFGLAAAVNHGCSISTLSALARGQWHMLATILGWVLGWWMLYLGAPDISYTRLATIFTPAWWLVLSIVAVSLLAIWRLSPAHRRIYAGVMVFGAVGGLLGVLEPLWSPSQLIRDVTERPLAMDMAVAWPSLGRVLISVAILAGMLVAARAHFRPGEYQGSLGRWMKHLLAGILMGIGASLALGGNDLQLLIALPAGSPGAVVALACMIAGIWIGLAVEERWERRQDRD
ncbi:YeeE/YedE thiosulfate transporter family protein [Halomonas sp. MMSF_3323]|uniref:YeeE/YedE thiosulfate transporter family protein n=1 Tax=Halomonas sp. MMSF_3323 TaxID=3046701 RepID=UPI00273DDC09|nr:YeeE/YedE thiosulfate transporter family protein [Halomonas sp. MMSF_3323]